MPWSGWCAQPSAAATCGPIGACQRRQARRQGRQIDVAEAGAALADRGEPVGGGVVGGQQQRAVDPGAAAPPGERPHHHQVQGVGQLGAVVALELDPLPAARAGLVAGRGVQRFADQPLAAVRHRLLEHPLQRRFVADLLGGGQPQPRRRRDRPLQPGAPLQVWQAGEVGAVGVQQVEAEQAYGEVARCLGDAVLAAAEHDLLERAQLAGGRVGGDRLAFQDHLPRPEALVEQLHDLQELGREAFQPAGVQLQLPVGGAVGLEADAVVLVLGRARAAEPGEDLGAVGQPLGEMGRTGLPARTCICSTAASPPPARVAATRPRSEQML
jgi:hypothetical protein